SSATGTVSTSLIVPSAATSAEMDVSFCPTSERSAPISLNLTYTCGAAWPGSAFTSPKPVPSIANDTLSPATTVDSAVKDGTTGCAIAGNSAAQSMSATARAYRVDSAGNERDGHEMTSYDFAWSSSARGTSSTSSIVPSAATSAEIDVSSCPTSERSAPISLNLTYTCGSAWPGSAFTSPKPVPSIAIEI